MVCTLNFLSMPFNFLVWNCQGAGDNSFVNLLREFVKQNNCSMVVIVEPRINGFHAKRVINSTGFERSHRVESTGLSGGIQILWQEAVKIEVIGNHAQCIHIIVEHSMGNFWNLSVVYGHPNPYIRNSLWEELMTFARFVSKPWLITSDFNLFLFSHEKFRGFVRGSRPCLYF